MVHEVLAVLLCNRLGIVLVVTVHRYDTDDVDNGLR